MEKGRQAVNDPAPCSGGPGSNLQKKACNSKFGFRPQGLYELVAIGSQTLR